MALVEVGDGFPYSTIQAAINAAPSGGTVRANANVGNSYPEAILVNNKRIALYADLVDVNFLPAISLPGAGGGAAPAVQVTGTGGVDLSGFLISNVGSAAGFVVELNVAEDWLGFCIIDGGGSKVGAQCQFGDHCIIRNCTDGTQPSCGGQVMFDHFTVVNCSNSGLRGNATNGTFKGCLAYNNNAQGFVNALAQYCAWNFSDCPTAPGSLSVGGMTLAQIAFINYAGGDLRLAPGSVAYVPGVTPYPADITRRLRLRRGLDNRIYGGAHDPFPASPAWLSGSSQVRVI